MRMIHQLRQLIKLLITVRGTQSLSLILRLRRNLNVPKKETDDEVQNENDSSIKTINKDKDVDKEFELDLVPDLNDFTYTEESILEQFSLNRAPTRICWLFKLLEFMSKRGTPIKHCPYITNKIDDTIEKKPVDLWALYNFVRAEPCTTIPDISRSTNRKNKWTRVARLMNISDRHELKKIYIRYVLQFMLDEQLSSSRDARVIKFFKRYDTKRKFN